jgi:hypothetical protein
MNAKSFPNISYLFKTYLIGAMEKTSDGGCGESWRHILSPKLKERDIFVFDPTTMERQKTGMTTKEINEKLTGWITSGNIDKFLETMDCIWEGKTIVVEDQSIKEEQVMHMFGDKEYVFHSDFLILHFAKGDSWGGTLIEIAIAYYLTKIPIYLVTKEPISTINKSALKHILMSGQKRGDYANHNPVFANFTALLEYLDKTYKLKKKGE